MEDNKVEVSVVVPFIMWKNIIFLPGKHIKQNGVQFEIICVEDCSTDKTKEILKKYEQKV